MKTLSEKPTELHTISKVAELGYRALNKLPFLPCSRRYNITVCMSYKAIYLVQSSQGRQRNNIRSFIER